ncbi:MAG: redoxin domain-containing protein [Bacteriovoracaceae bacterium]
MKSMIVSLLLVIAPTIVKAQNFTLKNQDQKEVSLSDFKGKTVVLEWLNHGCPFVRKHYDSGNMQKLQEKWTKNGVVWLSIISSAPGTQGYVNFEDAKKEGKSNNSKASHILLDPEGKAGRLYEAKTTPHMYIFNKQGERVYEGAIDSIPDTKIDSIAKATNYVDEALTQLSQNQKVRVAKTKAYGCSVKYAE